jgi:hypothetical protein
MQGLLPADDAPRRESWCDCYHIETTSRTAKNIEDIDNNKWNNKLPSTASWPRFSPRRFGPRWCRSMWGLLPADDAPTQQSWLDARRREHRTGGRTEFDV